MPRATTRAIIFYNVGTRLLTKFSPFLYVKMLFISISLLFGSLKKIFDEICFSICVPMGML